MENRRFNGAGRRERRGRNSYAKKLIVYLQEDVPGLEVEYEKFLDRVEEETSDPQWNIQNHPARSVLDRFPHGFGAWVTWLEELFWLGGAGYPFDKDDLTVLEWKGLVIIKQWNQKVTQAADRKLRTE